MAGWLGRVLRRDRHLKLPPQAAEAAAEELLVMDEALEEISTLAGLQNVASSRKLPHGFLRRWKRALAAYDGYVKLILRHADGGKGLVVQCHAGCRGCCHDAPTGVQGMEYLAIYHRYRSFPDCDTLHNGACDNIDALFEEVRKVAPDATTLQSDDRTFQRAQLAYRTRARPCVFLDPGPGTCRIYDVRPIPCRMHFAVSDPELCWPGHPRAQDAVAPNLPPPESIVKTMKEIARRMGLDHLSPVLFQGVVQLGHETFQMKPLSEAAARQKLERRRKRDP